MSCPAELETARRTIATQPPSASGSADSSPVLATPPGLGLVEPEHSAVKLVLPGAVLRCWHQTRGHCDNLLTDTDVNIHRQPVRLATSFSGALLLQPSS